MNVQVNVRIIGDIRHRIIDDQGLKIEQTAVLEILSKSPVLVQLEVVVDVKEKGRLLHHRQKSEKMTGTGEMTETGKTIGTGEMIETGKMIEIGKTIETEETTEIAEMTEIGKTDMTNK